MSAPASVVVTRPVYQTTINSNDPRYKCCCNSIHVITGGIIIGILEILGSVSNIIGLIAKKANGTEVAQGNVYYGSISSLIWLIVVALMFVGINKKQHQWIVPHLVIQILGIIGMFIGAIAMIIIGATTGTVASTAVHIQNTENHQTVNGFSHIDTQINGEVIQVASATFIAVGIVLIIAAILEIWFFLVILKLYRFLRDQAMYGVGQQPQYLQHQVIQTYPAQYGQQQFAQPQNMYPQAQQVDQAPPAYEKMP